MIKESLIDYRFKVSCNDGPVKVITTVADSEDKAIKYVKDMYSQEHTTYADDRENKWDIKSLTEALKPRDSSEKLITLLVRDPDKQLENLLDHIKTSSKAGHSFPVEVDPEDSEYKESYYIDGDGSCAILEIEVIQGDDVEEEL